MRNINYKHLEKYQDIMANVEPLQEPESETVVDQDPKQSLLQVIYSIGADGWPVGDLAYFVSNKSNPEVQRFILENLMQDVSAAANPSVEGLDDDTITCFTRQSGESKIDYLNRLNSSIQKDVYIINEAQRSIHSSKKASDQDVK